MIIINCVMRATLRNVDVRHTQTHTARTETHRDRQTDRHYTILIQGKNQRHLASSFTLTRSNVDDID